MRHLDGMRAVADLFDGFIVDLWGVVHDGVLAMPGAVECLRQMRRAGKRVVLLSNAPRRAHSVVRQLDDFGVTADLYDRVVTSGEMTRSLLITRKDRFFDGLGGRLYLLGPPRDATLVDGVDQERVSRLEDADYLLNTGPDDAGPGSAEHFRPLLERARTLRLPMLCANPDLEIVRGGQRIICAGLLAQDFATMGGTVKLIGKPDPAIYVPIIARFGLAPLRICAIGDALATDIAGATNAGLASVWVLGGIHNHLLGRPAQADREAEAAGLAPIAALPLFTW